MTDRETGPDAPVDDDEPDDAVNVVESSLDDSEAEVEQHLTDSAEAPEIPDVETVEDVTSEPTGEVAAAESVGVIGEEPADPQWLDAIGAFVLGALPPEDARRASEEYARSAVAQAEIAELLPVADILTSLYQPQPAQVSQVDAAIPVEREKGVGPRAATRGSESRVSGVQGEAATRRPGAPSSIRGLPLARVLMAGLALLAAIGVIWALALTDQIGTKNDEIDALNRQIAELSLSNASAFALYPTADGGTAQGTVFYSPANASVLLDVVGLPPLEEDRIYQVWFQRAGESTWEPGPIFAVNSRGETVQHLAGESPAFSQIAITNEAEPGSSVPTEPFLLTGTLAAANG